MKDVLVIDDNLFALEIISEWLLETWKANVITVETIQDALLKIEESIHLDLIICDYELPDGNGIDVLNALNFQKRPVPFILFTGRFDLKFDINFPLFDVVDNKCYDTLFKKITDNYKDYAKYRIT